MPDTIQVSWSKDSCCYLKSLQVPAHEVVIDVDADEERDQIKMWKTSLFAAKIMTLILTMCMGKMQELKEVFNYLGSMCPVIGDKELNRRATKFLESLSDPGTFMTKVTSFKNLVPANKKVI